MMEDLGGEIDLVKWDEEMRERANAAARERYWNLSEEEKEKRKAKS